MLNHATLSLGTATLLAMKLPSQLVTIDITSVALHHPDSDVEDDDLCKLVW